MGAFGSLFSSESESRQSTTTQGIEQGAQATGGLAPVINLQGSDLLASGKNSEAVTETNLEVNSVINSTTNTTDLGAVQSALDFSRESQEQLIAEGSNVATSGLNAATDLTKTSLAFGKSNVSDVLDANVSTVRESLGVVSDSQDAIIDVSRAAIDNSANALDVNASVSREALNTVSGLSSDVFAQASELVRETSIQSNNVVTRALDAAGNAISGSLQAFTKFTQPGGGQTADVVKNLAIGAAIVAGLFVIGQRVAK